MHGKVNASHFCYICHTKVNHTCATNVIDPCLGMLHKSDPYMHEK